MPATSPAQRRLMGMAEHNPSAVYSKDRGVLKMSHQQLHDFAATKGLSDGKDKAVKRRMKRGQGQ